ncbi:hypothetical protein Fmac_011628 [Flemingia macrophylla]|uniref:Uncharacterized protein n=1 Tax=Flemingia macrophylla TaxID=520843 RepID=A0ABD1MN01_9FABA
MPPNLTIHDIEIMDATTISLKHNQSYRTLLCFDYAPTHHDLYAELACLDRAATSRKKRKSFDGLDGTTPPDVETTGGSKVTKKNTEKNVKNNFYGLLDEEEEQSPEMVSRLERLKKKKKNNHLHEQEEHWTTTQVEKKTGHVNLQRCYTQKKKKIASHSPFFQKTQMTFSLEETEDKG